MATEWVVTTGTRTQVAATASPGSSRILRDSLRILSSSELQPSSLSDPAHGTTFMASGAGNGPRSSPTTRRTSPGCDPMSRLPATLLSWSCSVSMPSWPAPEAAWYDEANRRVSSSSACSAPSTTIMDSVVQLGLAMMPFGRLRAARALTSGTTRGTSGSIRNEPELSTAIAPRSAAIGAHSAETSSGTSNIATSTPSNTSGASAWTSTSSPRTGSLRPAERAEATSRISPQTFCRVDRIWRITVPTAPVAPTMASEGRSLSVIGLYLRRRLPRPPPCRGRRPGVGPPQQCPRLRHELQQKYEFRT